MIGEIGGDLDGPSARDPANGTKPVVGFIAGVTAPTSRTMCPQAPSCQVNESAEAKKRVMRECGIHVVDSPADIGSKMAEVLGR